MDNTTFSSEIELFRAAAELLRINVEDEDRRASTRHKYDALVSIAPYIRGNCSKESLIPVRCKDVSKSGISFVAQQLDENRLMLIQLNTDPPIRLVARVVRQKPLDDAGFAHLVSCQFMAKAEN